jgi:hypothetical protein
MLHVDAFAYRHDGTFTPDMRENAMLLAGDAWVAGFRAALTREPPDGGGEPEPQWRCFHCDKVFTERADRLRNAEFRADHAVGLLDAAGISFDSKPVARAETGPVRVGDDWAGIYLRGDDALALAMAVECARDALPLSEGVNLTGWPDILRGCHEPCEVVPLYASPPVAQEPDDWEIRRNADGSVDGIVGTGHFHLEQMDSDVWWCGLTRNGERLTWVICGTMLWLDDVPALLRAKAVLEGFTEPTGGDNG